MNVNHLKIFAAVADRGNYTTVAEDIGMNASSVSRSVSHLEELLGIRLFHRTTRCLSLTEAGEEFLSQIRSPLEQLESAVELVRTLNEVPSGLLKMTASVTFGEKIILPLIPEFQNQYPNIRLELNFTDTVVDLVRGGTDLAIRLKPADRNDLVQTRLADTKYCVCASPGYLECEPALESPYDLTKHKCVAFMLPEYRTYWLFRKTNSINSNIIRVPITSDLVISSALSIHTATHLELGPSLLPEWLVREDLSSGRLINIFPDYSVTATEFDTHAWAVYSSRTYLPLKVRAMVDFLRDKFGDGDFNK